MLDFINFFYNSYFPIQVFSLTKRFTKRMNINMNERLGECNYHTINGY